MELTLRAGCWTKN